MSSQVQPALVRYGYGVIAVTVALGAALALRFFDLEGFLFVIAVAVSVWFGGRGPGLVAVALSMILLDYFFLSPTDGPWTILPSHVVYFVAFLVLAFVISWLSDLRHRAEQSLLQARNALEAKVHERTAELQRSNEQLRKEIAERARAEAEIRQQAELLSLAHDAVIVRDRDSRVIFWNRGAEETYGWTAREANGKATHELLQTTFPVSLDAVEAILCEQDKWAGELRHVRRDGSPIVVASRWSLQRDEQGAPSVVLEINRDITDRKRAEEALRNTQAELAHVTRVTTLGEVTASFAHEVNQPLAAIANNANACLGLLPNGRHDLDEVREALTDIISDADRASAIIERVRGLATRSSAEKIPLPLVGVVEDVVALAASESVPRRVTIRTDVPSDLPAVAGDRVQLQQVLLNLVVNGMDSMSAVDERERLLEIRGCRDMLDGTPAATISVRDHGIGLQADQMARLFEAFYTTKPHGMGMGLAISRSIIDAHGGRLWAESNRGRGATFSFMLPAAIPTAPTSG